MYPWRMLLVNRLVDGAWRAGISDGSRVVDAATVHDYGDGPPTVRRLLESGADEVEAALERAAARLQGGSSGLTPLSEARLGPPVPDPDKLLCLGYNYAEHASESNIAVPVAPNIFAKFRNCLVGPADEVVLPAVSESIDYEGELAVVIGRRCRNVSEADALQYVGGYTILNDVTARDLQFRTTQYTAGKALDTFAPMGPGVVPAREIPDPQALRIRTRLNGELVQDGSTSEMVFSVVQTISFLSQLMTLEPGDIIATGTPVGVGYKRNPPLFLHAGDVVEVSIDGIGSISNRVVAAR
jgi:acylpyruvate hydrolase